MIRLFNVYYPTRTLVLLICEALLAGGSFLLAAAYLFGPDTYIELIYEDGLLKIVGITLLTILLSYYFDLYEPQRISKGWEAYFRLLLVLSTLCFILAGLVYVFPDLYLGHNVLTLGVSILTIFLIVWRWIYEWIGGLAIFRDRVYVLGNGASARLLVDTLRSRRDAGMEVVGWREDGQSSGQRDRYAAELRAFMNSESSLDRVIIAMEERRGVLPIRELLDLRLRGIAIEDAGAVLERLMGKIPLDGLYPSDLIFTPGFRVKASQQIVRRMVSFTVALIGLLICLPFIPFIILAVRLSSPGPVFFNQTRVGHRGRLFTAHKFRTMRQDAEAAGAVWATKDDPRITPLGGFMRKTRLDEIPQLWNVLRGDMGFVGPRPERPEFVQWLSNAPHDPSRHYRLGSGPVQVWCNARRDQTKARIRPLLPEASIPRS